MQDKLMECFINPAKCKIFIEVYTKGTATAKQLAQACSDIPQATLYRHLKRMTADGVLCVAEEHPVRGTVEKVYAPAVDFADFEKELTGENAGQAYMQLFMQYITGIAGEFREYCSRPGIDIKAEISSFTIAPVCATDEELTAAVMEIGEIVTRLYNNKPAPGRKQRSFGIIITPPKD